MAINHKTKNVLPLLNNGNLLTKCDRIFVHIGLMRPKLVDVYLSYQTLNENYDANEPNSEQYKMVNECMNVYIGAFACNHDAHDILVQAHNHALTFLSDNNFEITNL